MELMDKQKGQTGILILVGILVLVSVAGGAYFLGSSNNPIQAPVQPVYQQAVKSPIPAVTESASSADISNWKTYSNKAFTFKYPTTGYVQTDQQSLVGVTNAQHTPPYFIFNINITDNINHLTTKQVVEKKIEDMRNNQFNPSAKTQADKISQTMNEYKNGQIDGIKLATFFEGYPTGSGEVLMAKDNFICDFTINDGNGEVDASYEEMLDQILSTFKFTQ